MARFQIGQRVKRIRTVSAVVPCGARGVVTGYDFPAGGKEVCSVRWDKPYSQFSGSGWFAYTLAPLTDPSADAWASEQIAKLKKLGPLPVKEAA